MGTSETLMMSRLFFLFKKYSKQMIFLPDPQPNMVGTFPSSQLGAPCSKSLDLGCSASWICKTYEVLVNGKSQDSRQHQQGATLSIMEYRY